MSKDQRLTITAGQRYHQWSTQNPAAQDDQTRMMVDAYRDEVFRYRAALGQIQGMMRAPNSTHTKACITCEGCLFEWEETIQIVRNVLDGKNPDDHWGEPVRLKP